MTSAAPASGPIASPSCWKQLNRVTTICRVHQIMLDTTRLHHAASCSAPLADWWLGRHLGCGRVVVLYATLDGREGWHQQSCLRRAEHAEQRDILDHHHCNTVLYTSARPCPLPVPVLTACTAAGRCAVHRKSQRCHLSAAACQWLLRRCPR